MKILVVYYSMYGHVLKLARAAAVGAQTVAGVEVVLRRVQELDSNLAKLQGSKHAQAVLAQQQDIRIATVEDLQGADGVIFGTPTRFGNMCAQMKQYFDGAADLWAQGALEGKPAGVMVSTATTHGGQETTCLTMMPPLLHLGFIIVGVPYSTPGMLHTEGRGGTPYGATTVAGGKNDLEPAPEDLEIARALGRRVVDVAQKLRG
ncbi:MAG TPA: NAD(P)H:quinone oxidoreductase [Desulfobaccales bacterium]|nr:NAD(P)H:quinone oxidoreductase [Desulfobaccales bacterium]